MSVGGIATSMPCSTQVRCTESTSSTQIDIHVPAPPWPFRQRKISHSPEPTLPNVGGAPQSQHFVQPSLSNHAKLWRMSDTLRMGVIALACMEPPPASLARQVRTVLGRVMRSYCASQEIGRAHV